MLALLSLAALFGYSFTAHLLARDPRAYADNFFTFWSWSRFIHQAAHPASIYDFRVLDGYQHARDAGYRFHLPFAYPPSFLLLIWPLGLLPPAVAYGAFMMATLAGYIAACWHRAWGWRLAALALIAPSTVVTVFAAQNAFLTAGLMIAGCRLSARRPVLGGMAFGLMAYKPQFGLLIPIALVSAREWRGFLAAAVTEIGTAIASGLIFGWRTWLALPGAVAYLDRFTTRLVRLDQLSPTVTATLRFFHASPSVVNAGQAAAAVMAGAAVYFGFRRGFTPRAVRLLLVAAFIATPYAFYYDLPVVSYVALATWSDARHAETPLDGWEIAILALAVVLPYLLFFSPFDGSYGGIALTLLFGLAVRRSRLAAGHSPAPLAV